jgi:predicted RNase H-like nuclease
MTYPAALAANRASSSHGVGISKQCFNLFPKLRDVDRRMTPTRQEDVKEVHPELCFLELNGGAPMPHAKDTLPGMADRQVLLLAAGFTTLPTALTAYVGSHVQTDDILDAYAACWTAERILRKTAIVLPAQPPVDSKGLRMEMWR